MENNNPNQENINNNNNQQFNSGQFNQGQFNQGQFNQGQYNQGQFNQGQYNQQFYQQRPLFYFDGRYHISNEDRTAGWIAYIGLLGFIIALIIHFNKKTEIGAFHLRQALGLMCSGFAFGIVSVILIFIPIIGWLAILVIALALPVFMILGIINAAQGRFAPLPIVGDQFQKMFATTF